MILLDLLKLHSYKEDITPRKMIFVIGENLHGKVEKVINELLREKSEEILFLKLKDVCIKQLYTKALNKFGQQQTLAKTLDVTRQDLYHWKESKRRIPYDVLVNLCRIINVSSSSIKDSIIEEKIVRNGLTKDKIAKILAKRLNVTLNFTEKVIYKMRKDIPLIILIELLNLWKEFLYKTTKQLEDKKSEFQETFEYLKQNGKAYKVKAVKELTPTLSKIVGAMSADGCVVKNTNTINIIDEEEYNLIAFSKWINEIFGVLPRIKKVNGINAWSIKVDNRVIRRYLITFFEFSNGKKQHDYDIPEIIKNSTFEFQKACAYGVMCFDGVVRNNKHVGINIGSKKLRDSLYRIFKLDGLTVTKSKNSDSTGMWRIYSSGKLDKKQFEKWQTYFEPNTDRWFRIYEWLNGFSKSVDDIHDAEDILIKCYPSKSNTKITVSDIFNLFLDKKTISIKDILNDLKQRSILVHESALWHYTGLLREMKIVNKIRLSDNKNLYTLNQNVKEWRLPNRIINQQNLTN